MTRDINEKLANWSVPNRPDQQVLQGRYAVLEKLDADRHAADLFRANSDDKTGEIWAYMPYGPFSSQSTYYKWVRDMEHQDDPVFYAIKDIATDRFCGVASYLRISPEMGSIEVGHINFSPSLQRTRAATEAMYLMMKWAFEAGYRRYEWKCNAENIGSRKAAQRLGFSYEGIFRQAAVIKNRNRDTAWFAAIDKEWSSLEAAFQAWLAPSNFDASGMQVESLKDLTQLVGLAKDPALRG